MYDFIEDETKDMPQEAAAYEVALIYSWGHDRKKIKNTAPKINNWIRIPHYGLRVQF